MAGLLRRNLTEEKALIHGSRANFDASTKRDSDSSKSSSSKRSSIMSSLPEFKTKTRVRASTPRSKNGCVTCKMRRLKCGEEKPGCARCAKSGWNCDGYAVSNGYTTSTSSTASTNSFRVDPSPSSSTSSYGSSLALDLDEKEQRCFQTYIECNPTSLEPRWGYSDQTVKAMMLQEAHHNLCVRHALVAQGALARSFDKKTQWAYLRNFTVPQNSHHEYSLMQYEKALQGLRTSIDALEHGAGARATLISCLALAMFDFSCGNGGFATQHIHFGRKILAAWQSCSGQTSLCPSSQQQPHSRLRPPQPVPELPYFQTAMGNPYAPSPQFVFPRAELAYNPRPAEGFCKVNHIANEQSIDSGLASMFLYLDLQTIFANGIDFECTYISNFPVETSMTSNTFANLEGARQTRQTLLYDGYFLYLRSLKYHFLPKDQIPQDIIELRSQFIEKLHRWLFAVGPVLRNYVIDPSIHPLARPDSVRFSIVLLLIRLTGILQAPETAYDAFYPHFEYLLAVSEDVIEYERSFIPDMNPEETESFGFEVRIVPALYLIATKCRIGTLRHQATALLLNGKRREGIWDSTLSGKVAQWIIGLEEQNFGADGMIPEDGRVWGEVVERDLQTKRAVVRCRVNMVGKRGTWQEMRNAIYW